jgi:Putative auto-transporter adhesin, head GIN domain
MRTKSIFSLAFSLLFSATIYAQNTETRSVGNFSELSISGGYDKLTLVEGNESSVKITADGVSLDKILTENNGNELEIKMKRGSYQDTKITIVVTYKTLETINTSGSTDIFIENLKTEKFQFNASGSGDLTGNFEVKNLEINLSGSSDSKLSGNAENQEINISGSGDVDASKLKGNRADVAISGSGDVKLNVERVKSSVSGSGDITNIH